MRPNPMTKITNKKYFESKKAPLGACKLKLQS